MAATLGRFDALTLSAQMSILHASVGFHSMSFEQVVNKHEALLGDCEHCVPPRPGLTLNVRRMLAGHVVDMRQDYVWAASIVGEVETLVHHDYPDEGDTLVTIYATDDLATYLMKADREKNYNKAKRIRQDGVNRSRAVFGAESAIATFLTSALARFYQTEGKKEAAREHYDEVEASLSKFKLSDDMQESIATAGD